MKDRDFENFCAKNKPIGCLHKRHPEYRFAPVFRAENGDLLLGPNVKVPAGLEIREWNGSVFTA